MNYRHYRECHWRALGALGGLPCKDQPQVDNRRKGIRRQLADDARDAVASSALRQIWRGERLDAIASLCANDIARVGAYRGTNARRTVLNVMPVRVALHRRRKTLLPSYGRHRRSSRLP